MDFYVFLKSFEVFPVRKMMKTIVTFPIPCPLSETSKIQLRV